MRQRQGRSSWIVISVILLFLVGVAVVMLLLFLRDGESEELQVPTLQPTELVQQISPTASFTALPSPTLTPPPTVTQTTTLVPTSPPPTPIPATLLPELPPLPAPVEIALADPLYGDGVPPTYGRFGGLYDNQQLIQAGHIMINVPGDNPFYIDTFEVTNIQFVNFLNATGLTDMPLDDYGASALWVDGTQPDSPLRQDELGTWSVRSAALESLPTRWVSALAARAYCANIGGSLPTLDEWLWAAYYADPPRHYPWGDERPDRRFANFAGEELMPGNSLEPGRSWIGAFHMAGNAAEWVQVDEQSFGLIGGSFLDDAAAFEAALLDARPADAARPLPDSGFRCVWD